MNAENAKNLLKAVKDAEVEKARLHPLMCADDDAYRMQWLAACEAVRMAYKEAMYAGVICGAWDLYCRTPDAEELPVLEGALRFCCAKCRKDYLRERQIENDVAGRFDDMAYGND